MGAADFKEPPGHCSIVVATAGSYVFGVAWTDKNSTPVLRVSVESVTTGKFEPSELKNPKAGLNVQSFQVDVGSTKHIRIRAMYGGGIFDAPWAGVQGTIDETGVFRPEDTNTIPEGCRIQAHVSIPSTLPPVCPAPGTSPTG